MIRSSLLILVLAIFAFTVGGCSEKNYYEPSRIEGTISYDGELESPIAEVGYLGATLNNGGVITTEGMEEYRLPEGYRFVAQSGAAIWS